MNPNENDKTKKQKTTWLTTAFLALVLIGRAGAAELGAALDCAADVRLFDSHFGRYGHQPLRTIARDDKGVHIYPPALTQSVPQTGLYSYFSVAGDFEVSAAYEVIDMTPPASGYGKSFGVAVETAGPDDIISVARGVMVGKGGGYIVSRGYRAEGVIAYDSTHYPCAAKLGRLALRREKAEVICLAADSPGDELRELVRLPFTAATISKVRLFADTGDSHGSLDARFTRLQISAVEIAGGVTKYQPPRPWGWWRWAGLGGIGMAGPGLLMFRYRTGRWLWFRGRD